jgi:peptidyl-prolyl cis-trans isomerase A (cyclophilin A)
MKKIFLLLLCASTLVAQTKKKTTAKPTTKSVAAKTLHYSKTPGIYAEMETSKGKIVLSLTYTKTPITVANFISLAEGTNTFVTNDRKGKPYFDKLKFHRVIASFMIQGGCPLGTGTGDPGYKFKDEFDANLKHNKAGILSMANSGPGTNGSQFFITHKDTPWLDNKHSVFGEVVEGQKVVDAIVQNDEITKVTILRVGKVAKTFDAAKVFSNYMASKVEEDKKAEETKKIAEEKAKADKAKADAEYKAKYATVIANKVAEFNALKAKSTTTASGLQYVVTQKGIDKKPTEGKDIYVHYAGYFEDGTLFDSSYESVNKAYGKFDQNRASQNGYQPFPFKYGNKTGLIPGFLEGINLMNLNEKVVLFIPSNLGYGPRQYGIIPANSNLIFELEILENMPPPPVADKK